MISECSINLERIRQSLVGDLSAPEQLALDTHLLACPSCHAEQKRYSETLGLLKSVSDEPVPRHFFVYPLDRAANPWQLFRQMMPRWQVASACFAGLLMLTVAAGFSGVQVGNDQGKWSLSVGAVRGLSPADAAAIKTEILRAADEKSREMVFRYVQELRTELAGTRADLSQQQQIQLVSAMDRLESRLNDRISTTAENIRTTDQNTSMALYQTLSVQREQDIRTVNARLDTAVDNFQTKARQTDDILDTLLQIANLNLKQPGEQK